MLVIIDYGVGNLNSIKNMLKKLGHRDVIISSDPQELANARKYILPGVGHFDYGMRQLRSSGLIGVLHQEVVLNKKPLLGICLGAQILTRGSEEGVEPGLGWIDADTVKFDFSNNRRIKVPHMGWCDVKFSSSSHLFNGLSDDSRFYFVHSYHMQCDNSKDVVVKATYGYEFAAGFQKENILGMQFHPEKSHKYGMRLLKNYIENY